MIEAAVQTVRAGVDTLLAADLSALPGVDVVAVLTALEEQRRRLEAVDQRLLAEITQRGIAGEFARSSTADLLVHGLRVAPGEAKARVGRSVDIGPRVGLDGQVLLPTFPVVAAAVVAGDVSSAHVEVITACLDHVPTVLGPQTLEVAERFLVEAAGHEDPAALRRTAALLLQRLDPDGTEPREDEIARRRDFTLSSTRSGSVRPHGDWTPELGAVWQTIIDSLSAPVPATTDASGACVDPDPRTAGQRRHDAMLEAGLRLLRSGALPDHGGTPVTVLVRTTPADLADPDGVVHTANGGVLSTRQLLGLSGEPDLVTVLTRRNGAVLACGRTRRLATPTQRRALAARDGGCCFPGCTRPAAWAEVHHVIGWAEGGATDLDNLCLLCPYHHREHEKRGWRVHMSDGLPQWTPPAWIDPQRKPVRNRAHHPPDIPFADFPVLCPA